MARSKPVPRLGRVAGERPTVIFEFGQVWPLLTIAARMRSRACRRAVSGSPTRIITGSPLAMSASTSTRWPLTPTNATENARASSMSARPQNMLDGEAAGAVAEQAEHVDADLVKADAVRGQTTAPPACAAAMR